MKRYGIKVGGHLEKEFRASRPAVAVHRAMDYFGVSTNCDLTIRVRTLGNVQYEYQIKADVACEPEGSWKRETLREGPYKAKAMAEAIVETINAAGRWQDAKVKNARVVRVESKN